MRIVYVKTSQIKKYSVFWIYEPLDYSFDLANNLM